MNSILVMIMLMFINTYTHAGNNSTNSAAFLKIGAGAQMNSMGSAGCAKLNNTYAAYWNPAGLLYILDKYSIGITYGMLFEDIIQQDIHYVQKLNKNTAWGISLRYLSVGALERTSEEGIIGEFDVTNKYFNISIAKRLTYDICVGMNMKCIHLSVGGDEDIYANAYAGDIGLLWDVSDTICLGVNLQNIGTKVKFIEEAYSLPGNIKAGIGYYNDNLHVIMDIDSLNTAGMGMHIGCEYWLDDKIALRMGMIDTKRFTAGIGIRVKQTRLDYAWMLHEDIGITHMLSVGIRLPEKEEEVFQHEEIMKILPEIMPISKVAVPEVGYIEEDKIESQEVVPDEMVSPEKGIDIKFDTGSALLSSEFYDELNKLVRFMLKHPEIKIRIEGHTDNRPIHTDQFPSNQELSEARARAVYWYLIHQGISGDRMEIRGYGATRPVASNDTPEGRRKNRRVEIVIIKKE